MSIPTRNSLGILAAVALGLGTAAPAPARSCDFDLVPVDKRQPTTIMLGGTQTSLAQRMFGIPCSTSVTVLAGPGVYLVFDDNGKLTRNRCKPGAPCKPAPEAHAFLSQLVAGLPGQHAGGKRMDEDVHVPLGLPVGRIFSLARAGTFDFSALGGQWSLVLAQTGGRVPLVQQSGSERVFVLPPGRLQRGGKYQWTVTSGRGRYASGFDVLAAAEAQEVERDLGDKGITGTGTTREQKLDEMMVLFDHGLDYEAKLLARDLEL